MPQFAVFLRGINVGGHRKIPMAALRTLLADVTSDAGVRTYIASGNAVFQADGKSADWEQAISGAITAQFGFEVPVVVLDRLTLTQILQDCPFPLDSGKTVHAYFCYDMPQPDQNGIAAVQSPSEAVSVTGRVVWLYAPDGIGRSKLAAKMETLIGVQATARNLNTVVKMVQMLES